MVSFAAGGVSGHLCTSSVRSLVGFWLSKKVDILGGKDGFFSASGVCFFESRLRLYRIGFENT